MTLATGVALAVSVASPAVAEGIILGADNPNAIPGSYLVTLRDHESLRFRAVPEVAQGLAARYDGRLSHVYAAALRGFAIKMSESAARRLAADPAVRLVEQDGRVSALDTQSPTPSWGLDRIDQRALPLNNSYTYPTTASSVTAYIIDTGIRTTHSDFGGRAVWGTNTADTNNTDCNGHGTHVAGTVGGASYGVAKGVRLTAVKVLNCQGSGTFSGVTAGIDWVTNNHTTGLAVANISLGASGTNATMEQAVRNSIADGVVYAIASGNSNSDACNFTPARTAEAITVSASDSADARASFSNYGTCIDIFAPGVNITSVWNSSDTATNTISGTSMAAPHVAGGAALILAQSPALTPAGVAQQMYTDATPNVVTNAGTGTPNRLIWVGPVTPPAGIKPDVKYWNDVLLEVFRRQGGGPGPLARGAAIMHAGLFDAVNSATLSKTGSTQYDSYLTLQTVSQSVNINLAAGYTARDLLIYAFPAHQVYIEQKFTERYGSSSQNIARQLANAVVNNMTTARANDGSDSDPGYIPDGVLGSWRPTNGCTAVDPHWGNVRPFTMTSGSQFRRPPLASDYAMLLASAQYATNLAETREIGRDTSTTRTASQTQAAWFWANDLDGTYKPPGQLLEHTEIVADPRILDGLTYSRLFALVSLAMADAGIAAWDMKYLTSIDLWRPVTAIELDPTNPDPTWRSLSGYTPCFPAWVSGHATFAAAWAGVMRAELGDNVAFAATTEDPQAVGVTRTFTSFTAAATENALSRIWLGVHFRFDADDGMAAGYNIADHVLANYLRSRP